jgi:hypothetical protein
MKKLILLGMLVMMLGLVNSASAQCTVAVTDSLSPNGADFECLDVIEYEVCVAVPAGDEFCTLVDIDVYFFPPDSPPAGSICDDPAGAGGILVGHIDSLAPGEVTCFNSSDNSALAWEITECPCDEPEELIAFSGITYFAEGSELLRCDQEAAENTILPVEAPECGIDGPDTVCEGATGIEYCAVNPADTYEWVITGDAVIVGPTDGPCVEVDTTGDGSFSLGLTVCNEAGEEDCCDECDKPVDIIPGPECGIEGPDSLCEGATGKR